MKTSVLVTLTTLVALVAALPTRDDTREGVPVNDGIRVNKRGTRVNSGDDSWEVAVKEY